MTASRVRGSAAGLGGEHHGVADGELGERVRGADRVQQLEACLDGVGNRDQLLVESPAAICSSDCRSGGINAGLRSRPQQWLVMFQGSDTGIIPAGADGRPADSRLGSGRAGHTYSGRASVTRRSRQTTFGRYCSSQKQQPLGVR